MDAKAWAKLAALAGEYLGSSDSATVNLGYATQYLSEAGRRISGNANEEHLRGWATGAAAFAVAAAASTSGRPVDEIVRDIQSLISEPGFDGDDGELPDWLNSAFAFLGLATVKSAASEAERAAEEATRAAAVIVRMVDRFAAA